MSDQEKNENEEELYSSEEEKTENNSEETSAENEESNAFPTSVNDQITDSVTQVNTKVLGEEAAESDANNEEGTPAEETIEYALTPDVKAELEALKDHELIHISNNPEEFDGPMVDYVNELIAQRDLQSQADEVKAHHLTPEAMTEIKGLKEDELMHISINHANYDEAVVTFVNELIEERGLKPFIDEVKGQIEDTARQTEEEFAEMEAKVNKENELSYEQGSDDEVHFIMELDQLGIQYHLETREENDSMINHFFFTDEDFEKVLPISAQIETANDADITEEGDTVSAKAEKSGCMGTLLFLIALASALTWISL
jgi:hypothetical protein